MARKCPQCRVNDVLDSRWDKIRFRIMYFIFGEDVADVRQGAYTQGHVDGYMLAKKEKPLTAEDTLKYLDVE